MVKDLRNISILIGDVVYVDGLRDETNHQVEFDVLSIDVNRTEGGELLQLVTVFNKKTSNSMTVDPSRIEVTPYTLYHRMAQAGLLSIQALRAACIDTGDIVKAAELALKSLGIKATVKCSYSSFTFPIEVYEEGATEPFYTVDAYTDKKFLAEKEVAVRCAWSREGFSDIMSEYFKSEIKKARS